MMLLPSREPHCVVISSIGKFYKWEGTGRISRVAYPNDEKDAREEGAGHGSKYGEQRAGHHADKT